MTLKGQPRFNRGEKILNDLSYSPMTTRELLQINDIKQPALFAAVRRLRDKKLIRVVEWRRAEYRGSFIPVYGLGSGPDAKQPVPYTKSEIQRRYWARHRAAIAIRRSGLRSSFSVWTALFGTVAPPSPHHGS